MPNLIQGDTVMIRRGKEKGKRGTIKAIFPKAGKATIEGLNIVKRHTKAGGQQQNNMGGASNNGGIIEKENPLPLSVLMYVCEKCNTPTRVRHGAGPNGSSQRSCAKCGEPARESVKGKK
ncbi:MAG: 50S ribosomal protein L24 [Vulcanimicrobiaceae bacterium]